MRGGSTSDAWASFCQALEAWDASNTVSNSPAIISITDERNLRRRPRWVDEVGLAAVGPVGNKHSRQASTQLTQ